VYVKFESVSGLTSKSIVSAKGLKVGQVEEVSFGSDDKIVVKIMLEKTPETPSDSKFLIERDLLGDCDIKVELGENQRFLSSGDTLIGVDETPLSESTETIGLKNLLETLTGTSKQDSLLIELRRLNKNLEELEKDK
jgi:ABC-type transporter Mla subunit MlaD